MKQPLTELEKAILKPALEHPRGLVCFDCGERATHAVVEPVVRQKEPGGPAVLLGYRRYGYCQEHAPVNAKPLEGGR